jgi:hypothetical protein
VVWPSGLYILIRLVQQQTGGPLSWEQIVLVVGAAAGVLGSLGGLLVKGVVRFGYQVENEHKLLNDQIEDLRKQLTDQRAEGDKRYVEMVAQSNQRLVDTITEWRARYAELGQDRDFWRQNALKPVEAVERLTDVVEALKKGLEHDAH